MSKEPNKQEKLLITTYLNETEKVLRDTLSDDQRDEVMTKLKDCWSFLHVKSTFDEFQKHYKLKSLEPVEVFEVKRFMAEVFPNEEVNIETDERAGVLKVSVDLPQGKLSGEFVVEPEEPAAEKLAFTPFLACMSGDPGNAWVFGKTENMTEAEGRIALTAVEEEFWLSKKGLKLLKKNVPRSFGVFAENASGGALKARGLKRHYKGPGIVTSVDGEGK